jgi:hypothetical protein
MPLSGPFVFAAFVCRVCASNILYCDRHDGPFSPPTTSWPALESGMTWVHDRWAGLRRSPRKPGPQWALDESKARLAQHDEHGNPGDIGDPCVAECVEDRDLGQNVPQIDRIRPLAEPAHRAACEKPSEYGSRPRHDTDQRHKCQSGPGDDHQGDTIGVVSVCQHG